MLNERRGDTTSNRIDGDPEKSRDVHVHMTHHQNGCCALTWTKTIAGFGKLKYNCVNKIMRCKQYNREIL